MWIQYCNNYINLKTNSDTLHCDINNNIVMTNVIIFIVVLLSIFNINDVLEIHISAQNQAHIFV